VRVWDALGLQRRGRAAHCPDPAHRDRNASAQVHDDGWICHGCGARGDAADLVGLVTGATDPVQQAQQVADLVLGGQLPQTVHYARALRRAERVERVAHGAPPERSTSWRRAEPSAEDRAAWLEVMAEVAAEARPLDRRCERWAKSRGLSPGALRRAGARRTPARWRPGWPKPLKADGVMFPAFGLDGGEVPLAWRIRPWPGSWWAAEVAKTLSTGGPWGTLPLGLRSARRPLLVVTEGEVDWLSAVDVYAGRAQVVGIVSVSSPVCAELEALVDGATRVVVLVHDTAEGRALYRRLARLRRARGGLIRHHPAESRDLNDLHAEPLGQLDALLDELGVWVPPAGVTDDRALLDAVASCEALGGEVLEGDF